MKNLESYTDEELVLEYNKSPENEILADHIFERYHSLISKLAAPLFMVGGEREDLIEYGRLGLLNAIKTYDPNLNDSFFPFAKLCITGQMKNAITASNRKKHMALNTSVSLNSDDSEEENTGIDKIKVSSPEDILMDMYETGNILDKIEENLSPAEKEVLLYLIEGFDYKQIAKILKKDLKSVDNAIQRIRKKSKALLRE